MARPKKGEGTHREPDASEKIVGLLAALLTKDDANDLAKVRRLAPLGLTTTEMAAACDTTDAVIRARLADLRRATTKKKRRNEEE